MPSKTGRHSGKKKDLSAEGRAAMAAAKGKSDADVVAVTNAVVAAAAAAVDISPDKATTVDKAQLGKDDYAKTPTAVSKTGANSSMMLAPTSVLARRVQNKAR